MKCPFCNSPLTKVTDSRDTDDGAAVRRRRQCLICNRRFTTYEVVEKTPLRVLKKNGEHELFNRDKLRSGIVRACEKRNISSEQIEDIVDRIERRIRNELKTEVSTETIGNLVMEELKKLDDVAYIRFASVYHEFKDLGSFMNEVHSMMDYNQKHHDDQKKEHPDNHKDQSKK